MDVLTKIRIFPTGMRLHEWIAFEEGYFREQRLDPEVMWDVYLGQMKGWTGGYKARPQDQPFLEGAQVIGNACAWGSVCNAGAGMGKFVPTPTAWRGTRSTCVPTRASVGPKISPACPLRSA
jgi:hypothetical protein